MYYQVSTRLKSELHKLTAVWMAKHCRPFSILEDKGHQDLLFAATSGAYKGPSRVTVKKTVIIDQRLEVCLGSCL